MDKRVRTTAMVLLIALVVLAGCTGGIGDASETTSKSTPESTDSPENRTNTANGTTESNEHPLADGSLSRNHAKALKDAGSFTIRTNVTMRGSETNVTPFRNVTTYVDVSSGEILTRTRKISPASRTTYVAPGGDQYRRSKQFEESSPEYRRPVIKLNVSNYLDSAPTWFVEAYNYTYTGTAMLDDERVHVYTVTTVEQWENQNATPGRYAPENVTNLDVRIYVTDMGLVKKFTYHVERDYEGEYVTTDMRIEYTDLGTTEVETPSWLSEAKAQATARTTVPDPGREVTETVRDESLGAAVTVTGPKYAMEHVELEHQTGGIWDTGEGGYRTAQVSPLVKIRLPYSSDVNVTAMELSYNGSAVPNGDERGLAVYRYNRTLQTFVRLETTINAEANVAYAETDREGTYLVMHIETWRELFR